MRAEGLDRGGFDVLATLRRGGRPFRLTPTRLYTELVLTSGAITHRVDALARAGLVERISGSRDRRSTLVGLTDQGRVVADRAMAANLACEAAMAGLLANTDREALIVAGCGPVGLTAALCLARAGVRVLALEKRAGLGTASLASTIHPPTLEILDGLGCWRR